MIFDTTLNTDLSLFWKQILQILYLAAPFLVVCGLAIGIVFYLILGEEKREAIGGYSECFMFGGLVSATDPIAVLALMKELNAHKHIRSLIEGESVINDGTAMIMFLMLLVGSESPLRILLKVHQMELAQFSYFF